MRRTLVLASLLAVAAALVVVGVALVSAAAGYIVAGLLLAGWSVLMFAEVGE